MEDVCYVSALKMSQIKFTFVVYFVLLCAFTFSQIFSNNIETQGNLYI